MTTPLTIEDVITKTHKSKLYHMLVAELVKGYGFYIISKVANDNEY